MREIKYRSWDKVNKKFARINDIVFNSDGSINQISTEYAEYGYEDEPFCLSDIVLVQYTGLKDKNGTEIYEGDIVKFLDAKEVVSFDCDCVGYTPFVNDMGCGCCSASNTGLPPEDTRVIGNIYENPELLEGEEWDD